MIWYYYFVIPHTYETESVLDARIYLWPMNSLPQIGKDGFTGSTAY